MNANRTHSTTRPDPSLTRAEPCRQGARLPPQAPLQGLLRYVMFGLSLGRRADQVSPSPLRSIPAARYLGVRYGLAVSSRHITTTTYSLRLLPLPCSPTCTLLPLPLLPASRPRRHGLAIALLSTTTTCDCPSPLPPTHPDLLPLPNASASAAPASRHNSCLPRPPRRLGWRLALPARPVRPR